MNTSSGRRRFGVGLSALACLLVVAAQPCQAILIGGASPDADHIAYGATFPSTGWVLASSSDGSETRTGSTTLIDPHWGITAAHVVRSAATIYSTATIGFGGNVSTN